MKEIRLPLKFGLTVAVHLAEPSILRSETEAEMPTPCTIIWNIMFPFLSVFRDIFDGLPSTVIPPIPFGPENAPLNASCTVALPSIRETKLVLGVTYAQLPRLNSTRSASNTKS